jgi:hypothetical protein
LAGPAHHSRRGLVAARLDSQNGEGAQSFDPVLDRDRL